MSEYQPPTIDPIAAARWQRAAPAHSPWLHEEVGRRMQERLQWICRTPQVWCDWNAVRGGQQTHALIAQRYPHAACYVAETQAHLHTTAQQLWSKPWWSLGRWSSTGQTHVAVPAAGSVDLLWANMALHHQAQPMQLLQAWHEMLATDGFLMFSCLGPDTAKEIRHLYGLQGWPAAGNSFTDMHDWGDMLVQAGFAEPVMDMETITLSFATPQRLLQELRELGCNLHPQRFAGLRGKKWLLQLQQALGEHLRVVQEDEQLLLTFEIIYGHAFKPQPRVRLQAENAVPLEQMRSMLKQNRS